MSKPKFLLVFLAFVMLASLGGLSTRTEAAASNRTPLKYEDVIQSLQKNNVNPKASERQSFFLNSVKGKVVELNNGNEVEVFIYQTAEEVAAAHQEFNDKMALIDIFVVPQVYEVKNAFLLYYDYQFSDILGTLY